MTALSANSTTVLSSSPAKSTLIRPGRSKAKQIEIPTDMLTNFCRRNHIRLLALFGSVLRDDFRPDSDVDVLVEFEPDHVPGLALIRMQDELSTLFGGRKVDLVTQKFLHPRIRERVLSEMEVHYVQC